MVYTHTFGCVIVRKFCVANLTFCSGSTSMKGSVAANSSFFAATVRESWRPTIVNCPLIRYYGEAVCVCVIITTCWPDSYSSDYNR